METAFAVAAVVFLVGMIVGLIKPKIALWWRKEPTPGRAVLTYGVGFLIVALMVGVVETLPDEQHLSGTASSEGERDGEEGVSEAKADLTSAERLDTIEALASDPDDFSDPSAYIDAVRLQVDGLRREYPDAEEVRRAEDILDEVVEEAESWRAELEAEERRREEVQRQQELERKWRYTTSEHGLTGETRTGAGIESENTIDLGFPYEGDQRGGLILGHGPELGFAVAFSIAQGQLMCPSYDPCDIRVRFDDGEVTNWSGSVLESQDPTQVSIRNGERFVGQLRHAEEVRIELPIYRAGRPVFTFEVGGFDYERFLDGN